MASNKPINVPIRNMSYGKIYGLLDTIESDDQEDIKNLMNYLDIEFIDKSFIENGRSKNDLSLSTSCLDIGNHLYDPNTPTPIEAVVKISQPDSDSDTEWKWRKQFKRAYEEDCVFAEDGIVNIDVRDASPMSLQGFLLLLKTES